MNAPNSEVDINILVSIYNQKLSTLTNQNILLEAKLQTLKQDYEQEKNSLLLKITELETDNHSKRKNLKTVDNQEFG
jgi:hypothetical protein